MRVQVDHQPEGLMEIISKDSHGCFGIGSFIFVLDESYKGFQMYGGFAIFDENCYFYNSSFPLIIALFDHLSTDA
jgi:hypothetical protein